MDLPQIPAAAAFALTLVLAGGCGGSDVASPISTTLAGQPSDTPVTTSDLPDPSVSATDTTSSGEVDAAEQPVNVYWMWSIADASSGSPERLAASSRPVPRDPEEALRALVDGPTEAERELGMTTSIAADAVVLGVSVQSGIAVADFAAGFDRAGGTLGETSLVAQIVHTLTQFDDVDAVRFSIDGASIDVVGSHGIEVGEGLDRGSFADLRPAVLVESPAPFAEVGGRFWLRGETATGSGVLVWTLVDGDGLIIVEGEADVSDIAPRVGFDVAVDVPAGAAGRGAIIVSLRSTETGRLQDSVDYPVWFVS